MSKFFTLDANHKSVVEQLDKLFRVYVKDLANVGGGMLDIVTWFAPYTVFIEIKFNIKLARIKKSQLEFLTSWPGHCGIALNIEEAANLATQPEIYCLTPSQKDKLAVYLRTMTAKEAHLNTILKLIA